MAKISSFFGVKQKVFYKRYFNLNKLDFIYLHIES